MTKRATLPTSIFPQLGGIVWRKRKALTENAPTKTQASCILTPSLQNSSTTQNPMDLLTTLSKQVQACSRCSLCQTRTQTVFGEGNPNAKLMLIGEAPGFHEDQQGLPFVGEAGQLLNKILSAIQLTREQVYIANILKCRPPENRDPLSDEIQTCTEYLLQQIQVIQPKIIVTLGRIASHYLLHNTKSLETLRGRPHHAPNLSATIFATYHPAYLLRKPEDKAKAWQDWKMIRDELKKE